jgi:hypothetical protein
LKKYLDQKQEKYCFLVCSDEKIKEGKFPNINFIFGPGNEIEDLFILSKTDFIIGSDSTFGAFASYYGNIPMKIMKNKNNCNWEYYFNKEKYFENKDNTTVQY